MTTTKNLQPRPQYLAHFLTKEASWKIRANRFRSDGILDVD